MIVPDRVASLLGERTLIDPARRAWRGNDDDLPTSLVKQQDQFVENGSAQPIKNAVWGARHNG